MFLNRLRYVIHMKCKNGYKKQKAEWYSGKWLKRYFLLHTCRKPVEKYSNNINNKYGGEMDSMWIGKY